MNHKVNNVQQLYDDAKNLYNNVVLGKADNIINSLDQAITTLKNSWAGMDAGIQINNVVDIYNAMTKIRNALASLAKDSSQIASSYREIQNANRANLENLAPLIIEGEKAPMASYQDTRDTVEISQEAMNGKTLLDNVNTSYEEFKSDVTRYYEAIMNNWQAGFGRSNAESAFGEFITNADKYKNVLNEVSQSITDAIKNYTM